MELAKPKGTMFKNKGKMITKSNHGRRPCRGKRHNNGMARGKGR